MSETKSIYSKKSLILTPKRFDDDETSVFNLSNDNCEASNCNDIPFGDVTPNLNSNFKYLQTRSQFSSLSHSISQINNRKKLYLSQNSQQMDSHLMFPIEKKNSSILKRFCFDILKFIFFILNCLFIIFVIEYFSIPKNLASILWDFFDYN